MRGLRTFLAAMFVTAAAAAQEPVHESPLRAHYQAYQAAAEAGDLAKAEAEAALALEASVAQGGDAPPTAAFAANLATTRLTNKRYAEAVEPAALALRIATARGEESGVDPRFAALLLARARLPAEGETAALRSALDAAKGVPTLQIPAFDTAADWAQTAQGGDDFLKAAEAWRLAQSFTDGEDERSVFRRARALTGEGTALVLADATSSESTEHGARGAAQLTLAIASLAPFAARDPASGDLTTSQALYAQAEAVRAAWFARAASDFGLPIVNAPLRMDRDGPAESSCLVEPTRPLDPRRLLDRVQYRGGLGAVVLKLTLTETGETVRSQLAGGIGGPELTAALAASSDALRFRPAKKSPEGCRMPSTIFFAVALSATPTTVRQGRLLLFWKPS